jgi:hypothetical protein
LAISAIKILLVAAVREPLEGQQEKKSGFVDLSQCHRGNSIGVLYTGALQIGLQRWDIQPFTTRDIWGLYRLILGLGYTRTKFWTQELSRLQTGIKPELLGTVRIYFEIQYGRG